MLLYSLLFPPLFLPSHPVRLLRFDGFGVGIAAVGVYETLFRQIPTKLRSRLSSLPPRFLGRLIQILCRLFLIGCTMGSRKLQFLKSSRILMAYIALLGLILVCRI